MLTYVCLTQRQQLTHRKMRLLPLLALLSSVLFYAHADTASADEADPLAPAAQSDSAEDLAGVQAAAAQAAVAAQQRAASAEEPSADTSSADTSSAEAQPAPMAMPAPRLPTPSTASMRRPLPASAPKVSKPEPFRQAYVLDEPAMFIGPEKTTVLQVSNRDVNRINCPTPVQDVFWSKEKPVSIQWDAENVFVKFKVRKEGDIESPVTVPVDVHIVCMNQVYTLILHPVERDSTTLRLGQGRDRQVSATLKEWGSLALEDKVKKLTLAVYRNELPSNFERGPIRDDRQYTRLWRNLAIRGVERVTAPGLGLAALEFEIVALKPVTLEERDFLNANFSAEIVGVTLDPPVLNGEHKKARLIIVERSVLNGR